jgi:hypothetical protein
VRLERVEREKAVDITNRPSEFWEPLLGLILRDCGNILTSNENTKAIQNLHIILSSYTSDRLDNSFQRRIARGIGPRTVTLKLNSRWYLTKNTVESFNLQLPWRQLISDVGSPDAEPELVFQIGTQRHLSEILLPSAATDADAISGVSAILSKRGFRGT